SSALHDPRARRRSGRPSGRDDLLSPAPKFILFIKLLHNSPRVSEGSDATRMRERRMGRDEPGALQRALSSLTRRLSSTRPLQEDSPAMRTFRTTTKLLVLGLVAALATLFAATLPAGAAKKQSEPVTLRLGYFPNVTHAPALVGVQGGIFKKALGSNVDLQSKTFNSGTEELTALQPGPLDAAYIRPNPPIPPWTQLDKGARVVSGAASGGAYFVVNKSINNAADLKGKTVASPQLGNTQDVSLRNWLKTKGLNTDTSGGGDVKIVPQDNATSLTQ